MTDQTLRLNKIEIGQFLNMKNKVGIPNNNGIAIRAEIESDTLYLSSNKPIAKKIYSQHLVTCGR
ncbi:MAG: hypothetical protein AB8U54_01885 [Rickettsia conorii subsp. raoultii]|uniref:hypothetical protein n=1 Tax=Rickettsia conorii TaxID=781 RepID=UPI003AEF34D0